MSKTAIVWRNVFNTEHSLYGYITNARDAAQAAGYPYFTWNGNVLDLKMHELGPIEALDGEEGPW